MYVLFRLFLRLFWWTFVWIHSWLIGKRTIIYPWTRRSASLPGQLKIVVVTDFLFQLKNQGQTKVSANLTVPCDTPHFLEQLPRILISIQDINFQMFALSPLQNFLNIQIHTCGASAMYFHTIFYIIFMPLHMVCALLIQLFLVSLCALVYLLEWMKLFV